MFTGDECEVRMDASGSFSFMLYIFIIALFLVGIYLLKHRDESKRFIKQYYQKQQQQQEGAGGFDDNQFDRRQQYMH